MKRIKNIWNDLISDENLTRAIVEVNRTHHWHKNHKPNRVTAWVEETKEERVVELRQILSNGFVPKEPRTSERWDVCAKKMRVINEPKQWPDQYVHHALIQVLQPIFMKGMDEWCCGSIRGRGISKAKSGIEKWVRDDVKGTKYELSLDITHFYDSLRPDVVMKRMRQMIKDRMVLDLIERVIKNGITIGAYTSQWFANTTLQPLDALIRQSGLCKRYVRYMDNFTIFGSNKRKIKKLKFLIEQWMSENGLEVKGNWQIFRISSGGLKNGRIPDAVGYRYGRKYTLPRKQNLFRIKRMLAKYRKRKNQGKKISFKMAAGLISRIGQLKHCNNCNIYKILFKGERILKELKRIVGKYQEKESLTWSMYLEQRAKRKSLEQKVIAIRT